MKTYCILTKAGKVIEIKSEAQPEIVAGFKGLGAWHWGYIKFLDSTKGLQAFFPMTEVVCIFDSEHGSITTK